MKPLWKGSISFGLVNIPIQLFTATESHAIGFTLLHATCHTPLKYHRWCPKCEKEVSWDHTVKGILTGKSYHVFTTELLKALHPKKSDTISIIEFVDEELIPVIYLNHHYYIAPGKNSDKAYALFVKALETTGKVAIGRFVLREKEHICALQSHENHLLLTTLYYAHEVKGLNNLALPKKSKIDSAELKLAQAFIEKLSVKKFDMTQFKDTFAQEIKRLLKTKPKKGKGKTKIIKVPATSKKKSSLVESLQASIKGITGTRSAHRAMASKRH